MQVGAKGHQAQPNNAIIVLCKDCSSSCFLISVSKPRFCQIVSLISVLKNMLKPGCVWLQVSKAPQILNGCHG